MAGKRNIKGITIEINGDTTKLDKALRQIDSSVKTTASSLKDVEKLLKLDPKNVDLLAQKQQYLAQNVDETAQRYEILKNAVETSTPDDALAKKWTADQAKLQKALDQTTQEVKTLEAQVAQMEDLGFGPDPQFLGRYQKELEEARAKAAGLKQQIADTYDELGRPISTESYQALQRELAETEQRLKDAQDAAENFSPESAITSANLKDLGSSLEGISGKAGAVSSAFAPVSGAVAALGAATLSTVPATAELRSDLSMLETNAANAGVSMDVVEEAFRRFNAVSGETDSSIEAISNLLQAGFDDNSLLRAVDSLSGAVISFPDTLKIESLADSLQETLATGEATGQYAELLERMGGSLEDYNKNLGLVLTAEQKRAIAIQDLAVNGLPQLAEGWRQNNEDLIQNKDATLQFQLSMAQLAETLLPIITSITNLASDLIGWFTDLPPEAQKAIGAIALVVGAISPVAGIIASITGALGAMATASALAAVGGTAVSLTLGKWLLIIAAVVAAVSGLIALLNVLFGKKDQMEDLDISATSTNTSFTGRSRLQGFASGGVFEPNSPILGVFGDNKTEREVAAPESMLRDLMREELAGTGGKTVTNVNIRFTGSLSQLGRLLQPVVTTETGRQGEYLAPKK